MNITDICNLALSYLGKGTIDSIDDQSENGRTCKVHYDLCRQMLLRDFTWGFSERVVKLAELSEQTVPGWDHVYAYPINCLAIRRVFAEDEAAQKYDYRNKFMVQIINPDVKVICTNVEAAYADYTYNTVDSGLFTPEFCVSLAHLLASSMAPALTGSENKVQIEMQQSQYYASKAKLAAAKEIERKPQYPDKYFTGRY